MLRPNFVGPSPFHSTVENMSGIAEAVHFPLSTRLIKAWKGGKETAGQKEEGTKAVSHHTPDADNKLERQRPMAGRGGCMLTRKTYTPALEAEAAPILPGVAAHLRAQVAREQARLWSMVRSSEKAEGAGPAHYQIEGGQVRNLFESRSARSLRLARNERNFTSICPSKVKSPSAS
jgi:hypothetical protein